MKYYKIRIVIPVVVGSNPISHPKPLKTPAFFVRAGVLLFAICRQFVNGLGQMSSQFFLCVSSTQSSVLNAMLGGRVLGAWGALGARGALGIRNRR